MSKHGNSMKWDICLNKGNAVLGVHLLLIFKRQHGKFGWQCWIPAIINIYETLYAVLIHDVGHKLFLSPAT